MEKTKDFEPVSDDGGMTANRINKREPRQHMPNWQAFVDETKEQLSKRGGRSSP